MQKIFFRCKHCGNLVGLIHEGNVPMICCGEPMEKLVPNTVDAAQEKHVPVCTLSGRELDVQVGSVPHPMEEQHFIMWVEIQQADKTQRAIFRPGQEPRAVFTIEEGVPVSAREYCNLHGLWKG